MLWSSLLSGSNEVATPGGGPSLEGRDIIEASPIGTGEQPADNVLVNYNYKRFKKPKSKKELIQEQKASGVGDYVPGSGSNKSDKELEEEADAQIARTLAKNEWEYERQISIGQDIKIDYSYTIIPLWDWEEEIRIARAMSRDTYAIFSFIETSKALFLSRTEQQITGSTYWPNYSITTVSTRYDEWDRVIYRETLVERGVASVAATAISEYYSRQIFGQINDEPCYERQVENFKYLYNSKKDKTGIVASPSTGLFVLDEDSPSDNDFNSLIEKETLTYQCFTALRDALIDPNIFAVSTHSAIKSRKGDSRYRMGGFDGEPKYLTRRVVELYGKRAAEVVARNSSGDINNTGDSRSNPANFTTEQVTITYIASFLSENGFNSNINFNAQKFWNLSQINSINRALEKENLVLDSIQISQKRGRMGTESRPNRASRLAAAYAKQVKGDQKAVLELDTNAAGKDTYKELTIPYVSDDILSYDPTTDTYTLQQSDAEQKALNYGRTQNALLLGNRNGISIQISANLMPPRPFSSIVIRDSNVSGVYRTNGTSYTFDSNGIIASTDALFAGGIK